MIVYAECCFFIPEAASLKDKRSVLKRMTDRVKNAYNVSIAEIDHQDLMATNDNRGRCRGLIKRCG